jgi:mannose-6-phosphate isomerase-like protein (cupin superfamily)
MRSAARPNPPSSATAAKYSSCRSSTGAPLIHLDPRSLLSATAPVTRAIPAVEWRPLSRRRSTMTVQDTALVVRPGEAATAPLGHGGAFELLADGGAVSANTLVLGVGADGARPHLHRTSSELFYVLEGTMLFSLNGELAEVGKGGLVVIPPDMPHAFGAADGSAAKVLAVLSPGIERFGYFQRLAAISRGEAGFDSLLPEQDRYDVHFVDLPDWRSAR